MSTLEINELNPVCLAVDGETLAQSTGAANFGTGYGFNVDDLYPFPRLYSRATPAEQLRRDSELAEARLNNLYDDQRLPGAVIHHDVTSPDVRHNSTWQLHGDENVRGQHAREDLLEKGDDADPGDDGIDIYESLWYYFEKNCELWSNDQDAESKLQQLLVAMTTQVADQFTDPGFFRLNMVDPVKAFAPDGKAPATEYLNFYPDPFPARYPKQPFDEDFRNDDVIAWVQLAYSSPFFRLQPYSEHLSNFPVTNEHFRRTAEFQNDDLDQAMADGRVFIVDFKDFHELNLRPQSDQSGGARLFTPIALFAVPKGSDKLKTICIQCTQHTPQSEAERNAWKADNTQPADRPLSDIMTPTDDYWSWQMAKTVFMSMYAMSSVVDHLSMHVYLGAIPVSLYRNIPRQHPLTALLEPHFMSLVSNNYAGIFAEAGSQQAMPGSYGAADKGLLTGAIPKVAGWTGQTFIDAAVMKAGDYDFVGNSTPIDRSKPNPYSLISDMPILDDQGTFPIIKRWAANYLSLYYRYDSDVVEDHELQLFVSELVTEAKVAGFPTSVTTIDELADMAARLIYWMSVNHALEATLGCIKLAPLSYWSDRVPRNDEVKTEADWLNAQPPINIGLAIFCASRLFVDLPREWYRSLGRFPEGQFVQDRRVYKHLETFQNELIDLDNRIEATNANRQWGYTMMRPATMTCSPWN